MTGIQKAQSYLTKSLLNTFFGFILILFIAIGIIDTQLYKSILAEDSIANWITFWMLALAGFISIFTAFTKSSPNKKLFFIVFGLFSFLAGLEEISWGQRVFNIQSSQFFIENSDQGEINLHNTAQKLLHIKTKHVAAIALLFF